MDTQGFDLRVEAVRLRTEERLSYNEIHARLGVPKSTLSGWLKQTPLTREELRKKMAVNSYEAPKKIRGSESTLHQMLEGRKLSPKDAAKVSEAAVLLRLVLHGLTTFGSVFDGDRADWLVDTPKGLCRVQVKTVRTASKHGLPTVGLQRTQGHSSKVRYSGEDFDVIAGYDLFTDICYVWTFDEVSHLNTTVTVHPEAAERWDKVIGAVVQRENDALAERR
jgi:transposase-like protein